MRAHLNPCDYFFVSADKAVSHGERHSHFSRSLPAKQHKHHPSHPCPLFHATEPFYVLPSSPSHVMEIYTKARKHTFLSHSRTCNADSETIIACVSDPSFTFGFCLHVSRVKGYKCVCHYIYWYHSWTIVIKEEYREELYYPTINYFTFIHIQWASSSFFHRNRIFLCCHQLPAWVS